MGAVEILQGAKSCSNYFVGYNGHASNIVGYCEVDLQVAFREYPHPPYNDIKLTGEEGRDNTCPFGRYEVHLDTHVPGKPGGNIDLKTDQFASLVFHGPWHKGGHAHSKDTAF